MYRYLLIVAMLGGATLAQAAGDDCGGLRRVAARYVAANGKQLSACYDLEQQTVRIVLDNGSRVVLPAALSGSGARYSDGTRTFWEHQGVGRYLVNDALQFEGALLPRATADTGH